MVQKIALLIIRYLVRSAGLEPARVLPHSDLNAARLPIPPRPLAIGIVRGAYRNDQTDSRVVFENDVAKGSFCGGGMENIFSPHILSACS